MKIVILIDSWEPIIGGGQKLFWELAVRLVKDNHCQIEIITRALKDKQAKKFNQNQNLFKGRLKITRLGPTLSWSNIFGRLWFIVQSAVYALKLKPDVYLASTFLPGFTLQLIKLFRKTPQVLVVIGFGAKNQFYQWLETLITQKFNYNLLITDDYNFYNQVKHKKKIKLIPNGVSLPVRQAGLPKTKSVAKWPDFTFLFVGRNEPRKGVKILKQAFSQVKKQFPQIKLRLFGPGFRIISQSQLEQELFKAHCLVLPSLWEGHPLILFEAWAHQLPVIATDVGSVSRFLDQSNGYLVPPRRVDQLAQAMVAAVKNPKLHQLGQQGYQLVSQHYSWEKTAHAYYQALAALVRQ